MTRLKQQGRREQYRLAGEDAPEWLALAFALIGTLTAMGTAWLLIGQAPWLKQPLAIEKTQQEQASPNPAASAGAESAQPPAQSETMAPAEQGPQNISTQTLADANKPQAMPVDCPPEVAINFKPGGVSLTAADKGTLEPLRQWLGSHPKARLLVEGYADAVGEEQANLILSYRRAKAVATLLNKSGVTQEQLAIRAAGEHQPIAGLPDNAAEYRRAYLQIEGSENCKNPSTSDRQ